VVDEFDEGYDNYDFINFFTGCCNYTFGLKNNNILYGCGDNSNPQELLKTYEILKSLAPEEKFVDVFLYKNDYHNLKVLIKEEISGVDGE
ncbi:V-type ATPase subunit, partial [Clostridioides difficile]|uniref:V-type ATPase subunit n=1 Tax=Clostridioides difficile TaxID=1496 RepID=UPI003F8D103A